MTSEPNTRDLPRRSERVVARVTAEQKRLLQRAAALQGRTLSDFLIACAQEAARRAIDEEQAIVLGARDSEAFVDALLNPKPVNDRLRESFQRYAEVMQRPEGG